MLKVEGIRVYMIVQGVGPQGLCCSCYNEFKNARMVITELHNPAWDYKRAVCDHCERLKTYRELPSYKDSDTV